MMDLCGKLRQHSSCNVQADVLQDLRYVLVGEVLVRGVVKSPANYERSCEPSNLQTIRHRPHVSGAVRAGRKRGPAMSDQLAKCVGRSSVGPGVQTAQRSRGRHERQRVSQTRASP